MPVINTSIKEINLRVGWNIINNPKNIASGDDKFKCTFCDKYLISPCSSKIKTQEGILQNGICGCIFHNDCIMEYISNGHKNCPKCNIEWISHNMFKSDLIHTFNIQETKIKKITKIK
jgi:transcription elongation factor Elf1